MLQKVKKKYEHFTRFLLLFLGCTENTESHEQARRRRLTDNFRQKGPGRLNDPAALNS